MPNVSPLFTGDKIRAASDYASRAGGGGGESKRPAAEANAFDVWSHSWDGLTSDVDQIAADPTTLVTGPYQYVGDLANAIGEGLTSEQNHQSPSATLDSAAAQLSALGDKASKVADANGALATVGATFELLVGAEQFITTPLAMIPFPAFPALRVGDMDFGLPHGHAHPPNLTPFGMIFLPSTGPVIPIPVISGASRTLINNMPAARCGDLGLSIWCGSYVPMYEVFLGSSSVWIEGARAARMGVDITNHCIFSARPKPNDPPIGPFTGTTYTGSPNVIIGGVPTPSLLSLGLGQLFKVLFKAAAKGVGKLRALREVTEAAANDVAEAADEVAAIADDADALADDVTAEMAAVAPPSAPITDAIDNILWEFSNRVREIARMSPTLKRQLEGLERAGWSITRGESSFCNRGSRSIHIQRQGSAPRDVGIIAHEVGHAYNPPIPEVPPAGLTKEQYVHANVGRDMLDEGGAQFNSAKVRDEIAHAGGPDASIPGQRSNEYADIYDRHKAGKITEEQAMNEMGDVMRNEVNSVDNTPYTDYYGRHYEQRYDDLNPPAAADTAPDAGDTLPRGMSAVDPDAADTLPHGMTAADPSAGDTLPMGTTAAEPGAGDTIPGWTPAGGS